MQLGGTRVLAAVDASLEAPYSDRGREGALRCHVEPPPPGGADAGGGAPREADRELAVELARVAERAIKQSGAVDMEALCVLPGRKVWSLRVDVRVLDDCGNAVDAVCLAALAALAAFRKPQTSVERGGSEDGEGGGGDGGGRVVVHPPEVREPQPLSLHHLPFAVTFALFGVSGRRGGGGPAEGREDAKGFVGLARARQEPLCNSGRSVLCVQTCVGPPANLTPSQLRTPPPASSTPMTMTATMTLYHRAASTPPSTRACRSRTPPRGRSRSCSTPTARSAPCRRPTASASTATS